MAGSQAAHLPARMCTRNLRHYQTDGGSVSGSLAEDLVDPQLGETLKNVKCERTTRDAGQVKLAAQQFDEVVGRETGVFDDSEQPMEAMPA